MGILGEGGDGYELAVRLENCAAWREWLGAASHAELLPHLSSPSAWHSFMNSSFAHLTLQMRVRALLFDRVAGCLFPGGNANRPFHAMAPSSLPSSFLQLDANGVYFPLEQDAEDWKCWQAEGSSNRAILPVKHDLHPVDNSIGNGEESRHGKVAPSTSFQQRSQGGQTFANLISPKQDRPSLNKVKKVEAWDGSDAKRPMEMVGTISKKMRSPKVSSKVSFQGDPLLNLSNRDHAADKMAINKSPPASRVMLEESKYSVIGGGTVAGRNGNQEHAEGGGLWYDRCLDKHLAERMKRVAHRSSQQKLPFKEQEACRRTREGMAAFHNQLTGRSTKVGVGRLGAEFNARVPNYGSFKQSSEDVNKFKEESIPMHEFKFLENSVPDNPVPAAKWRRLENNLTDRGLGDGLDISTRHANGCMRGSKRPGAKKEQDLIVKRELGLFSGSSKSVERLSKLQGHDANQMMEQTIAKAVARAGFDGLKQASMDILCDLMGCHMRKLGLGLKAFIDNCCKHGSQTEILKMYMQSSGMSIKDLMEHCKSGLQAETQAGSQASPKLANQRRKPVAQLPIQEMGPRQTPGGGSPVQQIQPPFSEKTLKRRQPSNLGRSKKAEKDKPVSDGKSAGEGKMDASLAGRGMKPMQISPRLHQQQSPWHQQIPLVQSQPSSLLQNYKQQLSSLQQL